MFFCFHVCKNNYVVFLFFVSMCVYKYKYIYIRKCCSQNWQHWRPVVEKNKQVTNYIYICWCSMEVLVSSSKGLLWCLHWWSKLYLLWFKNLQQSGIIIIIHDIWPSYNISPTWMSLKYFPNLAPKYCTKKGFPFLSYILGWGRVRPL